MSSVIELPIDKLMGVVFVRCPRCKELMDLEGEEYRDNGRTYVRVCLVCGKCGAKYCLNTPFVEVGG